ncbi:unnamed protein product [Owenia fusiformis]|uniref:Uncharacterized protein n=1 Tax=Owenia fusiformis TaxID=6347 RepID=A0A8J1XY13_OWEFU|nr:unnamed protein product [Owenia fusiformis]
MENFRLSENGDINVVIKQEPIDDDGFNITQCIKDEPLAAENKSENGLDISKKHDNTVVTTAAHTYRQETITSIKNDENTIIKEEYDVHSEEGEHFSREDLQTNQFAIKLETEEMNDHWDPNEIEFKVEDEVEGDEDTIYAKEEYDDLDGVDAVAQKQQDKLSDQQINTDCDKNNMMLNDSNAPDKVKPQVKKPHKCQDCDKSYVHKSALIRHSIKQNHNSYQCDVCEDFFKSFTDYKQHMIKHRKDDKKYFKCQYCDKQFIRKHNHKVHEGLHTGTSYKSKHSRENVNITNNDENVKSADGSVYANLERNKVEENEKCGITNCGEKVDINIKVENGNLECAEPQRENYGTDVNLDKSKDDKNDSLLNEKTERVSGDESSLHCCGIKFSSTKTLEVHKYLHHPKPQMKCNFCEKTFIHRNKLTSHERKHTSEKPFKCQFCDKYFKSPGSRSDHERNRCQFGKPFKCGLCGIGYAFLPLLKAHEQHKHMKDKQ